VRAAISKAAKQRKKPDRQAQAAEPAVGVTGSDSVNVQRRSARAVVRELLKPKQQTQRRTLELGKKSRKGLRSSAKYTSREKQAAGALHEWI
jgi:hypothetical protein